MSDRADAHQLRITDAIVQMLTDPQLDTEDVIGVLQPVIAFSQEQLDNARREASPG